MRRRSLIRKLIVLVVVAVGSSMLVSTGLALWQETERYAQSQRHILHATAQAFAAAAAGSVAARDRQQTLAALRAIGRVAGMMYAEVRTPDGDILAALGSAPHLINDVVMQDDDNPSLIRLLTSGTVLVSVPVINGGERIARIILISDAADLWPRLLSAWGFTLLGSAIALALGLIIAWRLQHAITVPLRRLVDAMRQIQKHHSYDISVQETVRESTDHEIGLLLDGFNGMLHDIRERDDHLAAYREGLEQKVADRTRELAAARDAAETANRAKSDFLATMSHEIRTPLNGIMVMAELLTTVDMPRRQRRLAEVIAHSGQTLLAIINDILDFSKVEAGKLKLESVHVDVVELVENVTSLFAERARVQTIDLAAMVDPACPRIITGDPVRLRQVVGNLVNNAIKFTTDGFVKLTVASCADDPRSIKIVVEDSGIGIAPDKLATIFDAFSQADQSTTRQFGGTGLGLAICRRLVEAMGGTIAVSSTLGKGSTFSVRLSAGTSVSRPWPCRRSAAGRLSCLIDVAGDATASVLTAYLEAGGYAVRRASGSIGARERDGAAIVLADVDRVAALALGTRDERAMAVVALHHLGDATADAAVASGQVDAALMRPVLPSEIEELLARLVAGDSKLSARAPDAPRHEALPQFAGLKALVADDSPVNLEVATQALERLGAAVHTVASGEEAVRAAATTAPDIILMDASMPGMDGFTATRAIRAAAQTAGRPRVPIVALTAHVIGAGADEWRRAGMDAVIHKPFTLAQLAGCLVDLLPHLQASSAGTPADDNRQPAPTQPSAQHQGTPAHDLLDAAVLAQLTSPAPARHGNFVNRVFDLYSEHAPKACQDLRRHAEACEIEACARAAHALNSMSSNIGAVAVAAVAAQIEQQARDDGKTPDADKLAALTTLLAQTLKALAAFVTQNGEVSAGEPVPPRGAAPHVALENELHHALARQELAAVYQPMVDRTGSHIVGVEALARWNRPGSDEISPEVFIPLAERSGFINEIGEWILRRACEDAASWPKLDVSVNVSPLQFCQPGLADRIERVLAETAMDARRLKIEITENALLVAEDAVLQAIDRLNRRGVTFALDDFGTGYSSLTYLRKFPFKTIKIDRSFVANVHLTFDATIVHAIVSIGRGLGLRIVAEGVETIEQKQFLSAAGVHLMQGFLFAPPMDKAALLERLAQEERVRCELRADGSRGFAAKNRC